MCAVHFGRKEERKKERKKEREGERKEERKAGRKGRRDVGRKGGRGKEEAIVNNLKRSEIASWEELE